LWEKSYGATRATTGMRIRLCDDGGYIVTGQIIASSGTDTNALLLKVLPDSTESWIVALGETDKTERGYDVIQTLDGGFAVAGHSRASGVDHTDIVLIKTDASGAKQWIRTYGSTADETAVSVRQTPDGGYLIGGTTKSYGAGEKDAFVIKTDSGGLTVGYGQ